MTNFQDLVAKVKNLVALAPVLGKISCPVIYFNMYLYCEPVQCVLPCCLINIFIGMASIEYQSGFFCSEMQSVSLLNLWARHLISNICLLHVILLSNSYIFCKLFKLVYNQDDILYLIHLTFSSL